jgi:hypothetical protein
MPLRIIAQRAFALNKSPPTIRVIEPPNVYISPRQQCLRLGTNEDAREPGNSQNDQSMEHPRFTLKDLGANRAVKIVVITALTICGTLETIFWARFFWPSKPEIENDSESSSS